MTILFRFLLFLNLYFVVNSAYASPFKNLVHSQARFIIEKPVVKIGDIIYAGLHIKIEPHWHVYWKNPGDSGAAPIIDLEFSESNIDTGKLKYPIPKRIIAEPLVTFGYEDEVLYLKPIQPTKNAKPGTVLIKMDVEYLICKVECIPVFAKFEDKIVIDSDIDNTSITIAKDIEQTFSKFSGVYPIKKRREVRYDLLGKSKLQFTIKHEGGAELDFFPEQSPWMSYHPMEKSVVDEGTVFSLPLKSSPQESFKGLLVENQNGQEKSYQINIRRATTLSEILYYALLALIGGLILNLMPCVFPILGIKMLTILSQASGSKQSIRVHTISFICGILLSFTFLGTIIALMKSFGQVLGWGFQLQSPSMIAVLSLLFAAISLNFLGVWDISFSLKVKPQKKGIISEFLNGILAVVVASPCTAPFMGAALGFAVTQSFPSLLTIFFCLGIGFAFPFILFAIFPQIVNLLPASGTWLLVFKKWMALPLFISLLWLLYIYFSIQGLPSLLLLISSIVIFALILLIWKKSKTRTILALEILCVGTIISSLGLPSQVSTVDSDFWHLYQHENAEEILNSSFPIFINFTAKWCITCQVNEVSSFQSEKLRSFFKKNDIKPIKVDWTKKQKHIAELIKSFGRISIPLYIFIASEAADPIVLPEILSPDIVIEQLQPFLEN